MNIAEAIQKMLDAHGDGWSLGQYVVAMGLERVVDGRIEAIAWHWHPPDQPGWMTTALLEEALRQRDAADIED